MRAAQLFLGDLNLFDFAGQVLVNVHLNRSLAVEQAAAAFGFFRGELKHEVLLAADNVNVALDRFRAG